MDTFLQYVVRNIYDKYGSFEDLIFVVPSIRSGTYLKKFIAKSTSTPIFSPPILSIENFIQEISQLKQTPNTELLFRLYSVYLKSDLKDKEDFHTFIRWGQTLLADFDELDRYLVNSQNLFAYLTAVTKLNTWGGQNGLTNLVSDYVKFTKTFEKLYSSFTQNLLETKDSYQGLRYRTAFQNITDYINKNKNKTHIFIGFNALNESEQHIIQAILEHTSAAIYWDIDKYFLDDPLHDASYFLNKHQRNWSYLKAKSLNGVSEYFLSEKRIHITGIPKKIAQAKHVGYLLKTLYSGGNITKPIALVLADETLLPAILNSIPEEVKHVNITMGYPLSDTTLSNFFSTLIEFYVINSSGTWYYKDILRLLSNPISTLLLHEDSSHITALSTTILSNNYTYLSPQELHELSEIENPMFSVLFSKQSIGSKVFIANALQILQLLKPSFNNPSQIIELESLNLFYKLFNQLSEYVSTQNYLNDLKSLKAVLSELISIEQINFQGSTTDSLQIMGMLESRTLDFETVIITSVNEGILPAGKNNNSFIPYDVKKEYGMPTFKDKDAVYTYHFYRLLQRAKHIYLTYNTEPDVLEGGEKSRFINQLMTDHNINQYIKHNIAIPETPQKLGFKKEITKTPPLLNQIKELCNKGFSPTSLTNYIKNPYGFYKQHILKIKDVQQVEETIAHNTFGTIIHDILEELYTPYIDVQLTEEILANIKSEVEKVVTKNFKKTYSSKNTNKGLNLIVLHVINKYINSVIDFELQELEKHQIKILGLEKELKIQLEIPELDFPIFLRGKLDRIDEVDGQLRIIDYKTGNVIPSEVEISSFEQLTIDDKKAKAFQLLCYALMFESNVSFKTLQAGILPVKNLTKGVLVFSIKSEIKPITKDSFISQGVLERFKEQLKSLVLEITNPKIPFKENLD